MLVASASDEAETARLTGTIFHPSTGDAPCPRQPPVCCDSANDYSDGLWSTESDSLEDDFEYDDVLTPTPSPKVAPVPLSAPPNVESSGGKRARPAPVPKTTGRGVGRGGGRGGRQGRGGGRGRGGRGGRGRAQSTRFDPLLSAHGNGQGEALRFAPVNIDTRPLLPAVQCATVIDDALERGIPSQTEDMLAYIDCLRDALRQARALVKDTERHWHDLRLNHTTALATLHGRMRDEIELAQVHAAQIAERAHAICTNRISQALKATESGGVLLKAADTVNSVDRSMLALHVHSSDRSMRGGFQDIPVVRWAMKGSGRLEH